MNFLSDLANKINLEPEAFCVVNEISKKIDCDVYQNLKQKFFDREDIGEDMENLAEALDVNIYELYLAVYLMFSERTLEIYREKGIDEQIFFDTMLDFPVWVNVCRRDFGIWGLMEHGWISNHLRVTLFRLGRLQFEVITYRYDNPYTRNGVTIKNGDPIINIHVPEGGPIPYDMRIDSYRRACKFFGLQWFTCGSWLLWDKHRDFLPETSNIISFMNDFDIIHAHESKSDGNLWRVFNKRDDGYKAENLPRDTGLRKAYAEHWEKYGTTGEGTGIFLFDGENIVR